MPLNSINNKVLKDVDISIVVTVLKEIFAQCCILKDHHKVIFINLSTITLHTKAIT
jgi:hypothetical protein